MRNPTLSRNHHSTQTSNSSGRVLELPASSDRQKNTKAKVVGMLCEVRVLGVDSSTNLDADVLVKPAAHVIRSLQMLRGLWVPVTSSRVN